MEEEEKKKGILSGIVNMFFEEEAVAPKSDSDLLEKVVEPTVPTTTITTATVDVITPTGDGIFDQKFNDMFQKLIEENNIPGVDYFEFKQSQINLANVPGLNESIVFQTAYTTLKAVDPSLTKESIVSSIDHYDNLLLKEEGNFNKALQSQTNKEVTSKKEKADKLNLEIAELIKQIQEINEKINDNQKEAIQLNSEAALSEAKISQTAKNFTTTLASVRGKLAEDKQKIITIVQ